MTIITNNPFLSIFTIISTLLICYGSYIDFSNTAQISFSSLVQLFLSFSASLLGIIFVVLEVKEKKSMFIIGIIGAVCSLIYLYLWSPLLWDMLISIIYIILNIYGLYYWNHPDKNQQDNTQHIITKTLTVKELVFYGIISIFGIYMLSFIGITWGKYQSNTQATVDSVTTVLSILAHWLVARKYIEMWYIWIFVNAISIPLYISIHSYTFTMLFVCYLIISFYGLFSWKKNIASISL